MPCGIQAVFEPGESRFPAFRHAAAKPIEAACVMMSTCCYPYTSGRGATRSFWSQGGARSTSDSWDARVREAHGWQADRLESVGV